MARAFNAGSADRLGQAAAQTLLEHGHKVVSTLAIATGSRPCATSKTATLGLNRHVGSFS